MQTNDQKPRGNLWKPLKTIQIHMKIYNKNNKSISEVHNGIHYIYMGIHEIYKGKLDEDPQIHKVILGIYKGNL